MVALALMCYLSRDCIKILQLILTMDQICSSNTRRIQAGKNLAETPAGENIVISGISGKFPNSNNVQHFMENLLDKADLCDDDERRWAHHNNDMPKISGKINNVEKFDNGYFGIPELQVHWMDPMCRLLLERSIEALMDAGINPVELKGTNTGVFIAVSFSELHKHSLYNNRLQQTYPIVGCIRSFLANRLNYALQVNGPSFTTDTACSSSIYALDAAYRSIREGKCDMAIVAGSNIHIEPMVTLAFARLGVLNMDTGCRPFDRDGDGFTRGEAAVVVILQKEKYSRRVYAKIVHSKVNSDGFKEQGITYPSSDDQLQLLKEVYEECAVDPKTVAYIEAHGTSTGIGDPVELSAIDRHFCSNRERPLLIGSVKGNMGHSEAAAGLSSLIKLLCGMNFGCILPNIHYDNPRPDIPALVKNRLTVVTEKTKWPDVSGFAGVNSFGFGGANTHVILEKFNKKKELLRDDVPRLVCFSGRTKEALTTIQDYLCSHDLDYEFIRLIQEIFSKNIENHIYRGFSIISPTKEIKRSACLFNNKKHTLYLCLGDDNSYSCSLLKELQQLLPFKETYQKCVEVLNNNNISIQLNETEPNNSIQKELLKVIVQLGILNTFKTLDITFDYVKGFSMGEFAAAYANGVLQLDETIMASYIVSKNLKALEKFNEQVFKKIYAELKSILDPKKLMVDKTKTSFNNKHLNDFVSNILNLKLIPPKCPEFKSDAVIININFKSKPDEDFIHLEPFKTSSNAVQLLCCIGNLYELGYHPRVDKLFPEIKWPVSSGTAILSPLIEWNHSKYYALIFEDETKNKKQFVINIQNTQTSFYKGHVIDGRPLFPATGYVYLVWSFFAEVIGKSLDNTRVRFENIKFLRITPFLKDSVSFLVSINKEGYFEIVDRDTPVATGRIFVLEEFEDLQEPNDDDESQILLKEEDIYKDLRIRGYEYKGVFKSIKQIKGNKSLINWTTNWISFLDTMLQLFLKLDNSKSLVIPTGIDRLIIDPESFLQHVKTLNSYKLVECFTNKTNNSGYTKGVQIIGLQTSAITRKRQVHQPILESYKFVPNILTTNVSTSTRINIQIVLENSLVINMRVLEVINEDSDTLQPLSTEVVKVLECIPFIQPDIILFTKKNHSVEMKDIQVKTGKISNNRNNVLYIGSNLLRNEKEMQFAKSAIIEDGFIITIENSEHPPHLDGLNVLTQHTINKKNIYLLRKFQQQLIHDAIDVSNLENLENWLNAVKENLTNSNRVILYAQNNNQSGILGFTNCLRREKYGKNISSYIIRDKAPSFDEDDVFYKHQIEKGMAINVYQNGNWGTYRHLPCRINDGVRCGHFYGSTGTRGDLSSLSWFQGKLSTKYDNICYIYYSSLNFKDIMLASGKITSLSNTQSSIEQEFVEGMEFSGRDKDGNRIMGIAKCGTISNMVQSTITWRVPSYWTLEDAATVPVVYLTVLKGFTEAKIKQGQSVLIHSGTGGIGQAAINICQYYNCNIFTTVGTYKKKEYLMKHYRNINITQIGNSRNTSFEDMIMRKTNGRGVDIVLNSLSEDKLHASLKCVAKGGHFIEIGRYDLSRDARISVDLLIKGCTFQSILIDVGARNEDLFALFQSMLDCALIKPLNRRVFEIDELQNAFRHMTTGNHIGKVLIKIRNEEEESVIRPREFSHIANPKFFCDPDLSYIILGGLGGFGLELANWLMFRDAKFLILSSRRGVTTGYQQKMIRYWNDNGVKIVVLLDDITTYEGCKRLIIKANNIAPVGAIFNLAVELRDGFFNNLTYKDFYASLGPKAYATMYLDHISRKLCPSLHQFVVFSSISCGRGNAGQTNYGMSNSIMERICEERKAKGFPALAIQWGAIGDVGIIVEKIKDDPESAVEGTLQQKITNCLEVLDKFLNHNEPVVSSIVVAEKHAAKKADNLYNTLLALLGITEIKSISMHATLPELGMDSMLTTEILLTLERDYDIFLSANKLRTLTLARLSDIYELMENKSSLKEVSNIGLEKYIEIKKIDEDTYQKATIEKSANKDMSKLILFIPGIEGNYMNMETLMNAVKYSSVCLQNNFESQVDEFEDFVQLYYPVVKNLINENNSFNIIAHSFGGGLALDTVLKLEKEGYVGKLVLLDTSIDFIFKLFSMFSNNYDKELEVKLILALLENYIPQTKLPEIAEELSRANTTKERVDIVKNLKYDDKTAFNKHLYKFTLSIFSVIMAFSRYKFSPVGKLKSKVLLCKPTLPVINDIPDDYGLSAYFEDLEVATFRGDHLSILKNKEMFNAINTFLDN